MPGNERIIDNDERFRMPVFCGLERLEEVVGTIHWQKQQFDGQLSAWSFHSAHNKGRPRICSIPEDSNVREAGENLFEHLKPLPA